MFYKEAEKFRIRLRGDYAISIHILWIRCFRYGVDQHYNENYFLYLLSSKHADVLLGFAKIKQMLLLTFSLSLFLTTRKSPPNKSQQFLSRQRPAWKQQLIQKPTLA